MDDDTCFELCPDVVADVVEGEAILIRLEDGMYFSMNAVGSRVWQLLENRFGLEAMTSLVATSGSANRETVARDLRAFLDRLVDLRLVRLADPRAPGEPPGFDPIGYEAPTVEMYEDMAELLAMDPPSPGRTLKSLDPK